MQSHFGGGGCRLGAFGHVAEPRLRFRAAQSAANSEVTKAEQLVLGHNHSIVLPVINKVVLWPGVERAGNSGWTPIIRLHVALSKAVRPGMAEGKPFWGVRHFSILMQTPAVAASEFCGVHPRLLAVT